MNKKPTVTIAVCAHNEEQNIVQFLRSVLAQKPKTVRIERILVLSDGSTDSTVALCKPFAPVVRVIDHRQRMGKSSRLNELYQSLTTDLLIQSDADVIFAHSAVTDAICAPLLADTRVGMTGGNPVPLPAKTFVEQAVNTTVEAYLQLRRTVRGGHNVFSSDGRLLAFRKKLVQSSHVPSTMIANDMYMYFCCLTGGYAYRFAQKAVVYFRSPQTVRDQIRQNTRFLAAPVRMTRYFPKQLVDRETSIPLDQRIRAMLQPFLKNPLGALYIFLINRYCSLHAGMVESRLTAHWIMANTTKKLTRHTAVLSVLFEHAGRGGEYAPL